MPMTGILTHRGMIIFHGVKGRLKQSEDPGLSGRSKVKRKIQTPDMTQSHGGSEVDFNSLVQIYCRQHFLKCTILFCLVLFIFHFSCLS